MNKCKGCGAILQDQDISKLGYCPSHLLETADYCQRCFKLIHYGKFSDFSSSIDFDGIFKYINSKNALIVYLVDSFNIDNSLIDNFNDYFQNSNVLVVANKIDIWPKSLNKAKILNFIEYKLNTSNIKFDAIEAFSCLNNEFIERIYNKIKKFNKKEVFVVGKVNSGKSSFINSLIKFRNIDRKEITSSFYPSTTLDLIRVDFKDFVLNDSPGIIDNSAIYSFLNSKNLKKVINLKEIKPISMSLYNDNVLCIGSIMYMIINCEDKLNINIYGNNFIKYHKCKNIDIENKFNSICSDSLYVPKLNKEYEYETKIIELDGKRNMLFIGGLANIDFINSKGLIKIIYPKGLDIKLERSLFRNDIK